MPRTEYLRWTTGATIYAKPAPIDADPSWADDVIAGAEVDTTGQFAFAALDNDTYYEVFLQADVAPASTDTPIAYFDSLTLLSQILEDTSTTIPALISDSGTGQFLIPLTIKTADGNVVPYCECVLTTTIVPTTVYTSGNSNSVGIVEFKVNEGTYYLWRNKRGYSFTDPVTIVISATGEVSLP